MLYVTWDPHKAESNVRKHGVSFETAQAVFRDEFAIVDQDRIENGERRWRTTGVVAERLIVVVAHTWEEDSGDEFARIISAREAKRHEQEYYRAERARLA